MSDTMTDLLGLKLSELLVEHEIETTIELTETGDNHPVLLIILNHEALGESIGVAFNLASAIAMGKKEFRAAMSKGIDNVIQMKMSQMSITGISQ